jgi:hypothetical protein
MNASTKPAPPVPSQPKTPSIEGIKWRIKGARAPIVDYIKQRGPFQIEGYEINLSKDGKFLQRKRV